MMTDYMYTGYDHQIDLRPYFPYLNWRMMPHSPHMVASDFGDYPADDPVVGLYRNHCGLWTMDEANLLFNWADRLPEDSIAVDLGCHIGWTTAHIAHAASIAKVYAVDNMLPVQQFTQRFWSNLNPWSSKIYSFPFTTEEFFKFSLSPKYISGAVIDAAHDAPWPLFDAMHSLELIGQTGWIIFHDAWGGPTIDAAIALQTRGMRTRFYDTPHGVIACWRGDIAPVDHVPDPDIDWAGKRASAAHYCPQFIDFLSKCE